MASIVTRDLSGLVKSTYTVESYQIPEAPVTAAVKTAAHHIVVVDRSGSMYGEIASVRTNLEKLFTLQEYANEDLRVSLVSYSSLGDTITHFAYQLISDVLKPGSVHIEALRQLRATAMTCISGGLATARSLVRPGEVTQITLHSDGYANHPSPSAEVKNLKRETDALAAMPGVTVNSIAYQDWCDFNLLNSVASAVGGSTVLVRSAKDLFDHLQTSTKSLIGGTATALVVPGVPGRTGYTVIVDEDGGRILGGRVDQDLQARSLNAAKATVYRVFEDVGKAPISEINYRASAALANYFLSQKQVAKARDVLRGTEHADLVKNHGRAMTASQVKDFTLASLNAAVNPETYFKGFTKVDFDALSKRAPLSVVFAAINKNARDLLVSMDSLNAGYVRRSLKRLPGARDAATGIVTLPTTKLIRKKDADFVPVSSIEPNTTTAIWNITVSIPSDLAKFGDGAIIDSVAGIDLNDLKDYRSFTVVAEGDVKIPRLTVKLKTKTAYAALQPFMEEQNLPFDHNQTYVIDLSDRGLLPAMAADGLSQDAVLNAAGELVTINTLLSFLKAASKAEGVSALYTPEQVAELKAVNLTQAMYFSGPTCTAHPDLNAAIGAGEVDSYTKYTVDIGTKDLLTLDRLHSANKFIDRWFTVIDSSGAKVDKPGVIDAIAFGAKVEKKTPGPKMKVTGADTVALPIYEALLFATASAGPLNTPALDNVSLVNLLKITRREDTTGIDPGVVFGEFTKALNDRKDVLLDEVTVPFAMFVGSTGGLPESWSNAQGPLDAEEFSKLFPDVSLTKDEKADGLFYGLPNGLLVTISAINENYTTALGLQNLKDAA